MNRRKEVKIYAIDIDDTITTKTCWNPEQCLRAKPNKKVVAHVKKLIQEKHFIYFYTNRADKLMPATFEWLRENGLPTIVSNHKLSFDYLIDDKTINPEEL